MYPKDMQEPTMVNGVNVTGIVQTCEAIKADPSLAAFKFRASNKWIDGGHNRSTIQGFHGCGQEDTTRTVPFVMDAAEPPVLLGKDQGANPVEYVLHALVGCMTTSMVYHAAARGIAIDGIESKLEGDLDLQGFLGLSDKVRKGYSGIRVAMKVKTEAKVEELQPLVKFSPVFDIVSGSVPVSVDIQTC
jgi:uncharacterized OsmC-like protein